MSSHHPLREKQKDICLAPELNDQISSYIIGGGPLM